MIREGVPRTRKTRGWGLELKYGVPRAYVPERRGNGMLPPREDVDSTPAHRVVFRDPDS